MAKLKYSTRKSRKHCKRWPIPTRRTRANSLRKLSRHTKLHTKLRSRCLPTKLFLPTTKPKSKGSSSYKNWMNFAWKPVRTPGSISKLSSRWDGPFVIDESNTDPLYELDPELELTLHRLRKARKIVVNNSSSSDSVIYSNQLSINISTSSSNIFVEPG
ncbi:hypothetical protein CR513_19866, partial [Mucuna pruriens]